MVGSILGGLFGKRLTIGDLMSIDQGRQMRASQSGVSLVDTYLTVKDESVVGKLKSLFTGSSIKMLYITLKFKVLSDTGNVHYVLIQLDPDFNASNMMGNKVRVYCDCNDFKFRSAYLLSKRGSLFENGKTKIALGEAITEAPKRTPNVLCKHGYAALGWLVMNYNNVMAGL